MNTHTLSGHTSVTVAKPPAEPGKPITLDNSITIAEIEALQAANHVVWIYKRKGVVIVDGFKRYRLERP